MDTTKITVQADIASSKQKVWDCYTNPLHIVNWNFASDDWQCPRAENDMKVGGKYCARMEAKDGSMGFDFEAVYDEVNDQDSFTYTMSDGRKAKVAFEEKDDATQIKVTFDAENSNTVEMQKGGWQAILDNFRKYVEAN